MKVWEFTSPFIQNTSSSPITKFPRKRGFRCSFENHRQKFRRRRESFSFNSCRTLIWYGYHLKSIASWFCWALRTEDRGRFFSHYHVDCSQADPLLPEYFPLIYLSFFFPNFLYFDLNHVASICWHYVRRLMKMVDYVPEKLFEIVLTLKQRFLFRNTFQQWMFIPELLTLAWWMVIKKFYTTAFRILANYLQVPKGLRKLVFRSI